jgi:hypothetical protein
MEKALKKVEAVKEQYVDGLITERDFWSAVADIALIRLNDLRGVADDHLVDDTFANNEEVK